MSKVSQKLDYIKRQKLFYKTQNEKVGDFITKGQEIKHELGLDALKNYVVDYFVDLELNTFFKELPLEAKATFSNQLLRHYATAYGNDFVFSVGRETKIKLDAYQEKILMNEDIIKVMKNKTEEPKEPKKPKGLRV
jgi:hypothetical protein